MSLWKIKKYPDDSLKNLEAMILSTAEDRDILDKLILEIKSYIEPPPPEVVLRWSRIVASSGDIIVKMFSKVEAAVRNTEGGRYIEILVECDACDYKFLDGAAKMDASAYVSKLRTTRSLFQGYDESLKRIEKSIENHFKYYYISQKNESN